MNNYILLKIKINKIFKNNYFLMEQKRYKIRVTGNTKIDTHTEYILSIEINSTTFSFSERYSILKKLTDTMKIESKNNGLFPKFPPKKFFGAEDAKFISKRQTELNTFFEAISNNPDFLNLPSLIKFIEEKKKNSEESKTQNNPPHVPIETKNKNAISNIGEKESKKMTPKEEKKSDEEFAKIVDETSKLFYDVNAFYDKDYVSDNKNFVNFFKNNDIKLDNETTFKSENDKNFGLIGTNDENINSIEVSSKTKIEELLKSWKSLEEKYNTNDLIATL